MTMIKEVMPRVIVVVTAAAMIVDMMMMTLTLIVKAIIVKITIANALAMIRVNP